MRDEVSAALRPLRIEARSPHRSLTLTLSPITCCDHLTTHWGIQLRNT